MGGAHHVAHRLADNLRPDAKPDQEPDPFALARADFDSDHIM
jgi:hypothetical protein